MSEYLLPSNKKRKLFAIRNGMIDLPSNFPQTKTKNIQEKCICGQTENMVHIYVCEILSEKENEEQFEHIFVVSIEQQLKVFKNLEKNLEKREMLKSFQKPPCDPSDSLYSPD